MTESLHIGITATRYGMSPDQHMMVRRLVIDIAAEHGPRLVAHHGLCVGGDAEFHVLVRAVTHDKIIGHPGPDWPAGELCARQLRCDELMDPMPHMKRNAAIVAASKIMIAAPYASDPPAVWSKGWSAPGMGGTWATIGMALKWLRRGLLRELHVVGRDGVILDHRAWDGGVR